jgi:hypothetical protein
MVILIYLDSDFRDLALYMNGRVVTPMWVDVLPEEWRQELLAVAEAGREGNQ